MHSHRTGQVAVSEVVITQFAMGKHVLCMHTLTASSDMIVFYYTQSGLQITSLHGL